MTVGISAAEKRCVVELPEKTAHEIAIALDDPEVRQALDGRPKLYGADPRKRDGAALTIQFSRKADSDEMTNVDFGSGGAPAGMTRLRELLERIEAEQVAVEPCKSVKGKF